MQVITIEAYRCVCGKVFLNEDDATECFVGCQPLLALSSKLAPNDLIVSTCFPSAVKTGHKFTYSVFLFQRFELVYMNKSQWAVRIYVTAPFLTKIELIVLEMVGNRNDLEKSLADLLNLSSSGMRVYFRSNLKEVKESGTFVLLEGDSDEHFFHLANEEEQVMLSTYLVELKQVCLDLEAIVKI